MEALSREIFATKILRLLNLASDSTILNERKYFLVLSTKENHNKIYVKARMSRRILKNAMQNIYYV